MEVHIRKCYDILGCTDVVIAWDDDSTFRHDIYPAYKGKRKSVEGIKEAREETKKVLLGFGYRSVYSPNHEADDALATMAVKNAADGVKSIIYSGDKDLHQMLRKGLVSQLLSFRSNFGNSEFRWRTYDGVHGIAGATGITAEQWIDFRCLTGDTSDNISGFPGIGPKRAKDVLRQWGSIDRYYESPLTHFVQKSVSRGMSKGRTSLELTRRLITLVHDAPIVEMDMADIASNVIKEELPF